MRTREETNAARVAFCVQLALLKAEAMQLKLYKVAAELHEILHGLGLDVAAQIECEFTAKGAGAGYLGQEE